MPGGRNVSDNIKELYKANEGRSKPRPRKQVIAIAMSEARRAGKSPSKGGGMFVPIRKGK